MIKVGCDCREILDLYMYTMYCVNSSLYLSSLIPVLGLPI